MKDVLETLLDLMGKNGREDDEKDDPIKDVILWVGDDQTPDAIELATEAAKAYARLQAIAEAAEGLEHAIKSLLHPTLYIYDVDFALAAYEKAVKGGS